MATAVLIGFEKAESMISWASISPPFGVIGLVRAAADTMQIRLNPSTPAARTVSGAEYLRIYNVFSLYLHLMWIAGLERLTRIGRKIASLPQV